MKLRHIPSMNKFVDLDARYPRYLTFTTMVNKLQAEMPLSEAVKLLYQAMEFGEQNSAIQYSGKNEFTVNFLRMSAPRALKILMRSHTLYAALKMMIKAMDIFNKQK